jgi:hypothetical protein
MNRRTRLVRVALAAIVLVGIGATYAAVEDSTATANNRVTSEAIPNQVDLRITPHSAGRVGGSNCNDVPTTDYLQNQDQGASTDLVALADAAPGDAIQTFVCVRNFGTKTANLDLATLYALSDLETACSGNEAPGDTTCTAGAAGELTSEVLVEVGTNNEVLQGNNRCDTGPNKRFRFGDPAGNPSGATAITEGASMAPITDIDDIAPGGTICLTIDLAYRSQNTTIAEENENQTDEVTFKLRFRATEVA